MNPETGKPYSHSHVARTARCVTLGLQGQRWNTAYHSDEVRGRKSSGDTMGVHYSSETDEWATPQDLYDELDSEFGFTLDVCANADNAKCERYFTVEDDGLSRVWKGVCWMNPPYGDVIGDWMQKAYESAVDGTTVVCLVPARTDTAWWWDTARYGEIRFLRGRLKFGNAQASAPFPSAVVVFGRPAAVKWWER